MSKPMFCVALITLSTGLVHAQSNAPAQAEVSVPITYVGSNLRAGLGINDDGDFSGEFLGFFGHDGDSTWMAEGWYGQGGAGGLKFGRHWLWGGRSLDEVIADPTGASVAKAFAAIDRNIEGDRKATLGFGVERERWFGDLYVSAGLTDERLVDTRSLVQTSTLSGTTASGRPFTQQRTLTTLTRVFEQAYDHGVGARFGRFFEETQLRLRAGFDREWGDYGSHQNTFSLMAEKYIPGSGHSFALGVESLRRSGDFVLDRSDTRGLLSWRYDFGGAQAYRAVQPYRDVEVTREVEVPGEPQLVRNEVGMDAATYFKLDRFSLQDADASELDALVAALRADNRVSRIRIVGHTCDLGPSAYNQALSERRANAVAEFLASRGVDRADMDIVGEGESNPSHPNDSADNRAKNRRVDVSFLSVEERTEPGAPRVETRSEWKREPVPAAPAWIERALRNPAAHKRAVDVYRFETTEQSEQLGPQVLVNRAPQAADDSVQVDRNASSVVIDVLANDSDPDGDSLRVSEVGSAANGSANLSGGRVLYTPREGFVGEDSFTYTISDGALSATATVRLQVRVGPPVAVDDTARTPRGVALTLNLLANDRDAAGESLSLIEVDGAANGSIEFDASGELRYTPAAGFVGEEVLGYRVRSSSGQEASAAVRISVFAEAPRPQPDAVTTPVDVAVSVNVLSNDRDPANDRLSLVEVAQPANGSLSFEANGAVRYTPAAGFVGSETLAYRVRNTAGIEASSTLTITVTDLPPLPPDARDDFATTTGSNPVVVDVLANDVDPRGLSIEVQSLGRPIRGTVTLQNDGRVLYQPNATWCGTDLFVYTIRNTAGLTDTAGVVVRRVASGSAGEADAKNCPI